MLRDWDKDGALNSYAIFMGHPVNISESDIPIVGKRKKEVTVVVKSNSMITNKCASKWPNRFAT